MKTNEWTHMSLKAQVNQMKPKKREKPQQIKRNKTFTNEVNVLKEDVIIVENMATKRQIVGNYMEKPNTESKQ